MSVKRNPGRSCQGQPNDRVVFFLAMDTCCSSLGVLLNHSQRVNWGSGAQHGQVVFPVVQGPLLLLQKGEAAD